LFLERPDGKEKFCARDPKIMADVLFKYRPTKGSNFGAAVASKDNLQAYWKAAACWLQTTNYPWYWFSAFDEPNKTGDIEQSFGVG
jgi:hypothetical protein